MAFKFHFSCLSLAPYNMIIMIITYWMHPLLNCSIWTDPCTFVQKP